MQFPTLAGESPKWNIVVVTWALVICCTTIMYIISVVYFSIMKHDDFIRRLFEVYSKIDWMKQVNLNLH